MTAPNAARSARPGWRGTDPDGGTWVRLISAAGTGNPIPVWRYVSPSGGSDYRRSQEEAEAAGLVDVVPQTHIDDLVKAHQEHVTELRQQRDEAQRELSTALADLSGTRAVPAPLDPGNPEHLRQVADVLGRLAPRSLGVTMTLLDGVLLGVRSLADRLDRERAEGEQDAADRKRAEEIAREAHGAYAVITPWDVLEKTTRENLASIALAGIRAERARQAVG